MRLLPLFLLVLLLSSCTYTRIWRRNFPNVTDHRLFKQMPVQHAETEFLFRTTAAPLKLPSQNDWTFYRGGKRITNSRVSLDKFFEKSNTTAFIVIRHDSILYERYFNGYKKDSKSMHFSINKAILSVLTSIAVKDGAFTGFDQQIGDFVPMYANDERGKVTIGNLIEMNSGFDCNDYANQFRFIRLYYGDSPQDFMKHRSLKDKPGEQFAYSSFSSMLMGICLEKATGMTYNKYLEEKMWKKIGTSYEGSMSTFTDGTAMAWGGLSSYPIDLVKFARLILNRGNWDGEQIIPEDYVNSCADRSEGPGKVWRYSRGFWLDTYNCLKEEEIKKLKFMDQKRYCEGEDQLFAGGFRGQILYVDFKKELIILRLGTGNGNRNWSKCVSMLGHLL